MRNTGGRFNIQYVYPGIADCFGINYAGLRGNSPPEIFRIAGINKRSINTHLSETYVKLSIGTAIQCVAGHDLIPMIEQGEKSDELSRLPAGYRQSANPAF